MVSLVDIDLSSKWIGNREPGKYCCDYPFWKVPPNFIAGIEFQDSNH
jgi:hypothetical protein